MSMKTTSIFVVLAVALVTSGCGKKLVTVNLPVSEILTTQDGKGDDAADHWAPALFCFCGGAGKSCDPKSFLISPNPNAVLVGYRNNYDPGTEPCNCWHWGACIWRGYVKFDFGSLPSKDVVAARLRWKSLAKKHEEGWAGPNQCKVKLYVAGEPWGKYKIGGEQFAEALTGAFLDESAPIGGIAREWVNGQRPNHGVFFVGPNEQMKEKSNDECRSQLNELQLEVTTAVKK